MKTIAFEEVFPAVAPEDEIALTFSLRLTRQQVEAWPEAERRKRIDRMVANIAAAAEIALDDEIAKKGWL